MHEVECPYCGSCNKIGYLEEEIFDHVCEVCCGEFEIEVETTIKLIASEIRYKECPICKEMKRYDEIIRYPVPVAWKEMYRLENAKYKSICNECWKKEFVKSFDKLEAEQ